MGNNLPVLAAATVSAFGVTLAGVYFLLKVLDRVALDQPNARSLHERPVPRTGGIAVLAGAALSLAFGAAELWLPMLLALALAVLSFIDDLRSLPSAWRLAAHLAAAGVLVWYFLSPMHPLELALLALAVAWLTDLYNFMDGSDGLAGGMSVIGFGCYALAAGVDGDLPLATLCSAIAASSAAFLIHNFHPARIFLGDVGSIPLGFLAGALGLIGWTGDHWPLWFPLLVFAPFIGDATVTLVKRLARGERVWQAHREHYYQRLVRMGFGHRGAAAAGYAAMLICALAALAGRDEAPQVQAAAFGGASLVLAAIAVWIDVRWLRYRKQQEASA
jgi:UDP-N-acetylmuramyl pentapeptide phosphotransferase/UDP-N-acetylglucosamine-1-phosphate transferase